MATTTGGDSFLRNALYANTAFCFLSGVILSAGARPLAEFSGLDRLPLRVVGLGLVLWSAVLFRFAGRQPLRRSEVVIAVAGDVAWVLGTVIVALVASSSFTGAGLVSFIVLGVVVGYFAAAQWIGLRRAAMS